MVLKTFRVISSSSEHSERHNPKGLWVAQAIAGGELFAPADNKEVKMLKHKVLRISQKNKRHQQVLRELLSDGWVVKSSNSQNQGYDFGKTCCFGFIFLPLALLGKKSDTIEYILEKEVPEPKDKINKPKQISKTKTNKK
jgi:hypothetical protein